MCELTFHGHQQASAFIPKLWESPAHACCWTTVTAVVSPCTMFSRKAGVVWDGVSHALMPPCCGDARQVLCLPLFLWMLCSSSCSTFTVDLKICFTLSSPENSYCQPSVFPDISILIVYIFRKNSELLYLWGLHKHTALQLLMSPAAPET